MRTTTAVLVMGLLLIGGVILAKRGSIQAAPSGAAPSIALAPVGQQREVAYVKALEATEGRATKAEWAKYVGARDSEYDKATTHMPAGMGFTVEVKGAAQIKRAQIDASAHALAQAERHLLTHSLTKPNRADAQRFMDQQDQEIASLNTLLSQQSDALRKLSEKGDSAGISQQINQIIHQRAETLAKRPLLGAPESLTAGERELAKRRYMKLISQQAIAKGGQP